MSVSPANVIAPKESGTQSRLAPWKKAAAALPIIDTVQVPLVKCKEMWTAVTGCKKTPLIISTREKACAPAGEIAIPPGPVNLERLEPATAIAGICALRQGDQTREVLVVGPEAEALSRVLRGINLDANLTRFYKPNGGPSLEGLRLVCATALIWYGEITSKINATIQSVDLLAIPKSRWGGAGKDLSKAADLEIMLKDGPEAFCERSGLKIETLLRAEKESKKSASTELETACNAYAIAYVLDCTSKLVSDDEMNGLSNILTFGMKKVRRYSSLAGSIPTADSITRQSIVARLVNMVGPGSEEEVRAEFQVARPVFTVAEVKETAAAPKAQRLSDEEQIAGIANALKEKDVPKEFIVKCFQDGMRNPEKIHEKYTRFKMHPARTKEPGEPERAAETTPQVFDSLDSRIARIEFGPAITSAMRAEGFEPLYVTLAVCKVFNYPLSPSPRKRDGVEGYLARYLHGKVRNPAKTAESVFSFMGDARLLVGNDKTMSINVGTENPTGSAILRAVRDGFRE